MNVDMHACKIGVTQTVSLTRALLPFFLFFCDSRPSAEISSMHHMPPAQT